MKKISVIFIFLAMIMLLANCSNEDIEINKDSTPNQTVNQTNNEIDKTNMDEVISHCILTRITGYKPTYKEFEAHKIYGIEERDDRIVVFLYFALRGYSFNDGYFQSEAGGKSPALVELIRKEGEYKVISFKECLTDDHTVDMFPKEYVEKALKEKAKDLNDSIKSQAEAWLKSQGRKEKMKHF